MLAVTTPASDPTLLTLAEIREAVGVSSVSDVTLTRLNERVSEMLAGACNLVRAGTAVLTLREETYTETVWYPSSPPDTLYLSRKPVIAVLTLTEDGTALVVDDDFELVSERSILRVVDGAPSYWAIGKTIVSYRAGYATVPPSLKELAAKLAVTLNAERGRDPSLGSKEIPGVMSESYRYGRPDDPLVSAEIMEGLRIGGFLHSETMVG